MCVSHGRQGDPVQVPLSQEIVTQPITFLRLMPGGAVPPRGGPNPYSPVDVDGDFGPDTIKALQRRVEGPAAHAEREHLLTGGGHRAGSRAGA